jgi:tubulin-specific chaperone A
MPPPSPLQIATSSLERLIKEEGSYHKELAQQVARIKRLEENEVDEDGNREFALKQEVCFRPFPY